uniref:Polysaccharide biosynthesis domain-containing protein n=1 Tax=Romanomermis culicivorax TaxID=13658 RepID=A0A915JWY4_ROMCU
MNFSLDQALSGNAEDYVNDPSLEAAWAIRCYENARLHMSLICSCNPKYLKLSENDDVLYEKFRSVFPKLNVGLVDETDLKSNTAKDTWREFLEVNANLVEDHNSGFLLRLDSKGNYDSENTILVVKLQFLAIEVARNREGNNETLRKQFSHKDIPPE